MITALLCEDSAEHLLRPDGRVTCSICIAAQHERRDCIAVPVHVDNAMRESPLLTSIEKDVAGFHVCGIDLFDQDGLTVTNRRPHASAVCSKSHPITG